MRDGGRTEQARRLWDYLEDQGQLRISFRELWRHIRRQYDSVDELRKILESLETLHYLRVVEEWPEPYGGRPSTWILVNPLALSKSGDNGDKTSVSKALKRGSVTNVTKNEGSSKDENETSPVVVEAQQPPAPSEVNPNTYEEIF